MERLINIDSKVTQLWSPITLRNPEDGGDTFSETSVLIRHGRKVPENIYQPSSIVGESTVSMECVSLPLPRNDNSTGTCHNIKGICETQRPRVSQGHPVPRDIDAGDLVL
jgi:hypothetical protein